MEVNTSSTEAVRFTKLRQAVQLALERSLNAANEQAFAQCFATLAPELSPATISQIRQQFIEQLSQNVQVRASLVAVRPVRLALTNPSASSRPKREFETICREQNVAEALNTLEQRIDAARAVSDHALTTYVVGICERYLRRSADTD